MDSSAWLSAEESIKSFCNSLTGVRGSSREFTGTCTQRRVKVAKALRFVSERRPTRGEEVHRWWDSQIGSMMTEPFDVIKKERVFGKLCVKVHTTFRGESRLAEDYLFLFLYA